MRMIELTIEIEKITIENDRTIIMLVVIKFAN